MENRYKDILENGNDQILALNVANQTLREILAKEVKRVSYPTMKVLEIGCGHGHSALPILRNNTDLEISLLDINPKMIKECKARLGEYSNRINFIQDDAINYLAYAKRYFTRFDIITSSWTIHNFPWKDKRKLFGAIYDRLQLNGSLLMMDKIYTDCSLESNELLGMQIRRFERYLQDPLSTAIIEHEMQDYLPKYRMDESRTIGELKKVGFRDIEVIDRVERDVVLKAVK